MQVLHMFQKILFWISLNNRYVNPYIFTLNTKVGGLESRDQSRSRLRFLDTSRLTFESVEIYLDGQDQLLKVSRSRVSIEISTKIEILGHKPCRDFVFWTVETSLDSRDRFFKLSRKSRLSRPALCQCRDRESRSRHDRDKSRPPSLLNTFVRFWENVKWF